MKDYYYAIDYKSKPIHAKKERSLYENEFQKSLADKWSIGNGILRSMKLSDM